MHVHQKLDTFAKLLFLYYIVYGQVHQSENESAHESENAKRTPKRNTKPLKVTSKGVIPGAVVSLGPLYFILPYFRIRYFYMANFYPR